MPKIYPALTQEEKQQILERHRYLVDEMNKNLPDEQKIAYDKDLEKRLDDQKLVAAYRIGLEMKAKREEQARIQADLEQRFGTLPPNAGNPLSRAVVYEFDTSGTPEAQQYNEQLYHDYLEDPAKVVYKQYSKAMNFNPKGIYDCQDDPQKLAEYYRDTYPLCEQGFNFSSVIRNGQPTKQMKQALSSMVKPMEVLSYPCTMMKSAVGIDFFACPQFTAEQAYLVQTTSRDLVAQSDESLRLALTNAMQGQEMESPHSYFDKFVQRNIPLQEGMFVKNRPVSFERDASGNETNVQEVSYDRIFQAGENANVRIEPRPQENLRQVEAMNTSYQQKYQAEWQRVFNERRGYNGAFDLNQIEAQHQGGFFERHILRSTSPEYTAFLQALREFNDPQSPNYLNQENLMSKGQAYLDHKASQGYTSLDKMKGTSLIRSKLVLATMEACGEVNKKSVETAWLGQAQNQPQRESFLSAENVAEEEVQVQDDAPVQEAVAQKDIDDPSASA